MHSTNNEINFKKEILMNLKSKCGDIYVTKSGMFTCCCSICPLEFENLNTFSNHILQGHLIHNFEFHNGQDEEIDINLENELKIENTAKTDCNKSKSGNKLQISVTETDKRCIQKLKLANNHLTKDRGTLKQTMQENVDSNKIIKDLVMDIKSEKTIKKPNLTNKCLENYGNDNILEKHDSKVLISPKKSEDCTFRISPTIGTSDPKTCDSNEKLNLENNFQKNLEICKDIGIVHGAKNNSEVIHSSGRQQKKSSDSCTNFESRKLNNYQKTYSCEFCGKTFDNQKAKYQMHLRSHTGEKPFKCTICLSAFTIQGNLNQHMSSCHSNDRPFKCTWDNCGKAFKKDRNRVWHERVHTGEKPYQCEECGQHFAFQHKLSLHKKQRHMDKKDRPHKCGQCGKAFIYPRQLREHIYTHTGEKPHQCEQCSRSFAKRSSLNEHKKLHSGEKKHVCEVCGRGFAQRAGYATHVKTHNLLAA